MYSNKLAIAIKVGGRILREESETVRLTFGTEFSVLIKNLHSVRALVSMSIDGTDIGDGASFIVPANSSIELERFMKAGNMDQGLRFKFIERTAKIEDGPRGIKADDGLVRIEYEFERLPMPVLKSYISQYGTHHSDLLGGGSRTLRSMKPTKSAAPDLMNSTDASWSSDLKSATVSSTHDSFSVRASSASASFGDYHDGMASCSNASYGAAAAASGEDGVLGRTMHTAAQPKSENGITVGGSVSDQKFVQGAYFPTDGVKHVMVLRLLGQIGETPIVKPLTVQTKIECPTCGKKNKSNVKFCGECGTGLIDV
jgi:hypothetical protein